MTAFKQQAAPSSQDAAEPSEGPVPPAEAGNAEVGEALCEKGSGHDELGAGAAAPAPVVDLETGSEESSQDSARALEIAERPASDPEASESAFVGEKLVKTTFQPEPAPTGPPLSLSCA